MKAMDNFFSFVGKVQSAVFDKAVCLVVCTGRSGRPEVGQYVFPLRANLFDPLHSRALSWMLGEP